MSDRHLHILRAVARRRRSDAKRDERTTSEDATPTPRGRELQRRAARTEAQVSAADARRRRPDEELPGANAR